jgi:hypothetical protein
MAATLKGAKPSALPVDEGAVQVEVLEGVVEDLMVPWWKSAA